MFCTRILFAQEIKENINNYILKYQYQQAIDCIEQYNDSSKEVMSQKYFCYEKLGNYSKALEILSSLTKRFPDDIHLKTQLAFCYKNVSMPDKSIEQFDELIKMDSSNTYFMIQKADLLYQLNLPDSAKLYYNRVWTINPNDFDTAIKLIKVTINQKNYQSAIQDLETIISFDSVNLQANLLSAYCFYLLPKYLKPIFF
jgi:tetratricopeptide (TPR) repeat protein